MRAVTKEQNKPITTFVIMLDKKKILFMGLMVVAGRRSDTLVGND